MGNNPKSHLSAGQIAQKVYDETTDRIRVDAQYSTSIDGELEIAIDSTEDSVTIGDVSGNKVTTTIIGSDTGLDVNVIGGTLNSTVSGTVNTNLNALAAFQTSQYTVGISAVPITSIPLTNRSSVGLKAITTASNIIYIGNSSGVTTSTGYPLFNHDSIQLDLKPTQQIWAIASAAAQNLMVIEIGG